MTVTTSTNKVQALGNGVTTSFPYSFRIYEASELVVTRTVIATGVDTVLVLNTNYTVTGAASYNGGNVVCSVAPATGTRLTIARVLDVTQETDLRNQGAYFAETHEDVFDRHTMVDQQQQEEINRSLRFPEADAALTSELPAAADRANKAVIFDDDGNVTVSDDDYNDQLANVTAQAGIATSAAASATSSASAASTSATASASSASASSASAAAAAASAIEASGYAGNFTPAGTGAVTTTAQLKMRERKSVIDFGGDPTGVADSTLAIQKLVTYLNSIGGGEGFFPVGRYKYTSASYTSPSSGTVLVGEGREASIIEFQGATDLGFYCWGEGSGIRSMGFDSAVTMTGGNYIQLAGTSSVLNDVHINKDYLGILIIGVAAQVSDITFSNGASGAVRIELDCGDASPTLSNILMYAQSAPFPSSGIKCTNVTAAILDNISTLTQGAGLAINPSGSDSVNNLQATNCFFDSCSTGIFIEPSGSANVSRISFVNCWSGTATNNGVAIGNSGSGIVKGINFINHQSMVCGGSGISTSGVITDINVIGGLYAQSVIGLYFGHTGNVKVIGADCGAYEGAAGNSQYGIAFAANCTNIVCHGNSCLGNGITGILDQTSNSVIKFIHSNIIPSYSKAAAITVGASPFDYVAPYDQTVYIASGTVTGVVVSGLAVFATTNVNVNLKMGQSVTVTYTGTIFMHYTA